MGKRWGRHETVFGIIVMKVLYYRPSDVPAPILTHPHPLPSQLCFWCPSELLSQDPFNYDRSSVDLWHLPICSLTTMVDVNPRRRRRRDCKKHGQQKKKRRANIVQSHLFIAAQDETRAIIRRHTNTEERTYLISCWVEEDKKRNLLFFIIHVIIHFRYGSNTTQPERDIYRGRPLQLECIFYVNITCIPFTMPQPRAGQEEQRGRANIK